jgi:hypothetical protein
MQRARLVYVAAALLTIVVGLLVHLGDALPPRAKDATGDALWAMMVAWWVGAFLPGKPMMARGAIALAIAWTVELTQLYHAPWIDALRSSSVVHLVLGSDFDARDLVAYAVGVALAVLLDFAVRRRRHAGTA